jgi:hypothetical protein
MTSDEMADMVDAWSALCGERLRVTIQHLPEVECCGRPSLWHVSILNEENLVITDGRGITLADAMRSADESLFVLQTAWKAVHSLLADHDWRDRVVTSNDEAL